MLEIRLLGSLELALDREPLDPPARQSGRLLLGCLALRRGLHARGDLAALLWPDVLESSARSSLRSAIAAIRRTLGHSADHYFLRVGDTIGLAEAHAVSVDAERFDALVAADEFEAALDLSRGPLLQGLDAEWVQQARADHLGRCSDVLGALASRAESRGSLDAAIRYTRRQVALTPLAEPPNRELIRRLAAAGDRASALAVYAQLAERFRRELQAVPSAQTRGLADEARNGPAADIAAPPPLPLPPPLRTALTDPFVDRVRELSVLTRSLSLAAEGNRQVVVIGGEPGIGKSALLAHLGAAVAPSAMVLLGRCRQPASIAVEPFIDAIRHYVSVASPERLERELPPAANELSALVPELAERALGSPLPRDLMEDGGRVSRAIVETLLAICRERPLVLLIEDLHEAGAATIRLVMQLLAGSERARLLVVLTLRDTELGRSPVLRKLTRQVRALPGAVYLTLDPMDARATAELARTFVGGEVSAEAARSLYSRSRGNPFFATQLLARNRPGAEGRTPGPFDGSPLPERAQDLVLDEIARLGSDAQACLAVASAIGAEFDLGTVTRVGSLDEDRVLDALDEAVVSHVIRELPSGVGHYEFRHALIRDAIYATLTGTRRAHVHRRVAEALGERSGSGDPPFRIIAEHLRHARDLVPAPQLADCAVKAADAAEAQRTYEDAAALYAGAADLLADRPEDAERRCRVLIALGHARRRAGQSEHVLASFFDAAAVARRLGRADLLVAAALGLCAVPFFPGDRPVDLAAVALLEGALEEVPDSDEATRARLLARLAGEHYYDPTRSRPDEVAEQALTLASRTRDPPARAAALNVSHFALRGDDGAAKRLALAKDLVELAREHGDTETLVPAFVHQTADQLELGDIGALETNANVLSELAAELAQPAYGWWAHLWRATSAIIQGRADEGERLARRAFGVGEAGFGESAELELRAQLLWLRIERGQLEELAASLPDLERMFSMLPVWGCLKARVLAEVGHTEDAAHAVADLTRGGLARLERDTNWLISASLLAETFARTRNAEGAAQLRSALEPRASHWATSARATVCLGPLAGPLALVSAVEGRGEQADSYYGTALEQCRITGASLAAARLEREYGLCRRSLETAVDH